MHQLPSALDRPKLEDQRAALIHFLDRRRPQGSLKNKLTVIFDGDPEVWGGRAVSPVHVVFSRGETADDHIKRMVNRSTQRKRLVVVTDDKGLQAAVKAAGARVVSGKVFLGQSRMVRRSSTDTEEDAEKKVIPSSLEANITREMRRIWLADDDAD